MKGTSNASASRLSVSRRDRRAGRNVPPGLRLERWHRTTMRRRWLAMAFALVIGFLFVANSVALGPAIHAVTSRPALLLLVLAVVTLVVDHVAARIDLRHDHVEQR